MRALSVIVALLLGGCGETVHVRLDRGESCTGDNAWLLKWIASARFRVVRDDGMTWDSTCVEPPHGPVSGAALEDFLADEVPAFRNVPKGGSWTIWIVGYNSGACGGVIQLCGYRTGVSFPPPDGTATVTAECAPAFSAEPGKNTNVKDCVNLP